LNNTNNEPSFEYEKHRRRAISTIIYFWDNFKEKMVELKSSCNETNFNIYISLARTYKLLILSDLDQMKKHDGFEQWRKNEANQLSVAIYKRLNKLQNPLSCNESKFIFCDYYWWTGWGKLFCLDNSRTVVIKLCAAAY
jgi:hypothetical protein